MYRCLNCGAEFEEPSYRHQFTDGFLKKTRICPECGIDDMEKLHLCRCGREYIKDEQDRCGQCEKEINDAMNEARERIKNCCNVDHQKAMEEVVWWIEREA
jgi:DNA-directed RNA polymerase subunit RPC12/RpoP